MNRFTTEFGMGSGGSNSLWSSSNSVGMSSRTLSLIGYVIDVCYRLSVLRIPAQSAGLLRDHANCLGVIWSSLTGN